LFNQANGQLSAYCTSALLVFKIVTTSSHLAMSNILAQALPFKQTYQNIGGTQDL
jgi:hypothetical protein